MKKVTNCLFAVSFLFCMADFSRAENAESAPVSDQQKQPDKLLELGSQLKDRDHEELDALKEARAVSTEYTLDPSSVELLVTMDPRGYGFRSRSHKMSATLDLDFILRGRTMLHYDYRFFDYFSVGFLAGIDLTSLSVYSRFRQHLASPTPWQFSLLGGISGKWRVTEWYLRSSFFLEPSFLFGPMWQSQNDANSNFFRLRPGLFGGIESVFDSGFTVVTRVGVEFPFDFGDSESHKELAEALFLLSFGFAL